MEGRGEDEGKPLTDAEGRGRVARRGGREGGWRGGVRTEDEGKPLTDAVKTVFGEDVLRLAVAHELLLLVVLVDAEELAGAVEHERNLHLTISLHRPCQTDGLYLLK